jgi:hypothetical protein
LPLARSGELQLAEVGGVIKHRLDGESVLVLDGLDALRDPGVGREVGAADGEVRFEEDDSEVVEGLVFELGKLAEVAGLAAGAVAAGLDLDTPTVLRDEVVAGVGALQRLDVELAGHQQLGVVRQRGLAGPDEVASGQLLHDLGPAPEDLQVGEFVEVERLNAADLVFEREFVLGHARMVASRRGRPVRTDD